MTRSAVEPNFGRKFALNLEGKEKEECRCIFNLEFNDENEHFDNDENPLALQCTLADY